MVCIKISFPLFRLEYINVDAVKQLMRIHFSRLKIRVVLGDFLASKYVFS